MIAPVGEIANSIQDRAGADNRTRVLLQVVRRALIMVLGALEDYLEMDRTIPPKAQR